jgi:hypothetical protein
MLLVSIMLIVQSNLVLPYVEASATVPSVPEFTLKYVTQSYDVPPTYGIDPYTGKQVITHEGYHIDNTTLQVMIKNQPFTSYKDESGNYTSLYYNFKFKGHYEEQWKNYPSDPLNGYISASQSDYTVVSLPNWQLGNVPAGGQVDVQVQALIGYDNPVNGYAGGWKTVFHYFTGEASDWSNTQTVTVSDSPTPSPSPIPSQEPQQTEPFPTTLVIGSVIAVIIVSTGLLVYFTKRKR